MSFEFITDGLTLISWRSHLCYRFESVRWQKDMKYLLLPALFCSCFSLSFQILHFLPLCVSHLQLCSASICILTAFPVSLPDHLGATFRAFQHLLPCTFLLDHLFFCFSSTSSLCTHASSVSIFLFNEDDLPILSKKKNNCSFNWTFCAVLLLLKTPMVQQTLNTAMKVCFHQAKFS